MTLMAEDRANDRAETIARPDDDDTTAVDPPTQAAHPLAWSSESDIQAPRRWRVQWRDAVLVLTALAVAAVAGLVSWVVLTRPSVTPRPAPAPPHSPSSVAVSATPAVLPPAQLPSISNEPPVVLPPVTKTVTESPSTVRVPVPSVADMDQRYVELLNRADIAVSDVDVATRGGRNICAALAAGQSKQSVANDVHSGSATLTGRQVIAVVDAATTVYCPSYYGPWMYYPN